VRILRRNSKSQQNARAALSFTVSITVGVLSTLLAGGLIFAFWMWPTQRPLIAFTAACIGGAAAVTAATYAGRSLALSAQQQREHLESSKRLGALKFVERWNNPGMHHVKLTARDVVREKRKTPELDLEKELEDRTKSANVADVLNFFEEMAIAIQLGLIDEGTVRQFFRGIVVTYYDAFGGWIEKRRSERSNPRFFKEYEWLWKQWKDL